MRHLFWAEADTYRVVVLIKPSSFNRYELQKNYIEPLVQRGIADSEVIAFTVSYNSDNKAPAKFIKEYLEQLLPVLESLSTKFLYVADANYFKVLTGQAKADPHYGYVLPCKIKGYEHMSVVLGLNHQALIYNPELQSKLDLSLSTLASGVVGTYQAIGTGIIHSAEYPRTLQEIHTALQKLHNYPSLTCDIECFSLRFNGAGIGTIAFAWDKHNGIAFAVDYTNVWNDDGSHHPEATVDIAAYAGFQRINHPVREMLLSFFMSYKGELTFHNAAFDVKILIYTLWMQNLLDTKGLLHGLDVMTERLHDTKIIAYLATNSTAGNVLGLKSLAHEFAGNWAKEDIKDIRRIPLDKLLQYNLVDALSTHYVRDKYYPIMVQDNQEDLYKSLMLPSLKLIIQIELTGMPLSKAKVQEVKAKLVDIQYKHFDVIQNSNVIKTLNLLLQTSAMEAANAKLKVKQHPIEKFANVAFNPNSGPQLQKLLYEQMGLPILDLTETKQPATGADTLEKLLNHAQQPAYKELLESLIGYGKVTKILSTFIPAFEQAISKDTINEVVWLHGSFNLGGTVSGRLSSSDPNLQNIPAGSEYGKLIKECFVSPDEWLFAGADFNSLEDMISALTTKDKNKLAVYEQGFDGHSLRAAYYFRDQCPDIVLTDVDSVNSIKKKYPHLRQDSKAPTFLLTYGGTYHGMMSNLGWDEEKSKAIEAGYHELYKESDEYVQKRLHQASKDGYVEVAFGLRVRTPLLKQVMFGKAKMPYEAAAEGRTAGNALGQSYGLLNNRAAVDFMRKVWASPYRYDIKPVALIHDAIYILIRDDTLIVEWANRELIKSMRWQELPEIQHPTVKLGAALDIFWPDWAHATTLPNDADKATILEVCRKSKIDMGM
jgi:DNA polymerase-1